MLATLQLVTGDSQLIKKGTKRRIQEVGQVTFSLRNRIVGMVATVAAVLVPAGLAWGCVALVSFRTTGTNVVAPGGTVEVFGGAFARGKPVDIRLDSADGPILFTHPNPLPSTMTSQFTVQVPIPADIKSGPHLLVATQDHFDMNVGIPARAAIYVNTSAPVAPAPEIRPTTLAAATGGTGAGTYLLIGLGVAAGGLLLAAGASVIAARRGSPGEPEGAQVSS
ncbi:MAG: hypothetical protein ACR2HM_10230 [Acidimicrobiales bacterium]